MISSYKRLSHIFCFIFNMLQCYTSRFWEKMKNLDSREYWTKGPYIYDIHTKWPILWPPIPHPQKWAKYPLFKNNRTRRQVTNFKTPHISPPPPQQTSLPYIRHKCMVTNSISMSFLKVFLSRAYMSQDHIIKMI